MIIFFITNRQAQSEICSKSAVMFDIFCCVGFDSLFFVKTGEKHPRFYIKIFCFLNIKKARKHGLFKVSIHLVSPIWLRELDLNQRPSGYEPDELPNCSIPRYSTVFLLLSLLSAYLLYHKWMWMSIPFLQFFYFDWNVGLSIILDTIIKKFDRRKPFEGTHRTVVCST